jgi:hypothetical protein
MPHRLARAIALALAAATASASAACGMLPSGPAAVQSIRPPAPRGSAASAGAGLAVPLPDSTAWVNAAAALAGRFAVADSSWSPGEPPAAWLAALRPLTAPRLYAVLAQSAWTPAALARRDRTRQAATTAMTGEQVRDLDPGSVTFTVQVRQRITSTTGTSQSDLDLAITVTASGTRQVVWDIEPAADGNTGEGGSADDPAAP